MIFHSNSPYIDCSCFHRHCTRTQLATNMETTPKTPFVRLDPANEGKIRKECRDALCEFGPACYNFRHLGAPFPTPPIACMDGAQGYSECDSAGQQWSLLVGVDSIFP